MPAIDTLIAGIALHGNFQPAIRNVKDFQNPGVSIINPWIIEGQGEMTP